jgi:hypothetical protein
VLNKKIKDIESKMSIQKENGEKEELEKIIK